MDQYLLDQFAAATHNEIYDTYGNDQNGEWLYNHNETHESFDYFIESAEKDWAWASKEKFSEIAGLKFMSFSKIQLTKNTPRQSLSIIDFGNVRVVIYGVDLIYFV